MPSNLTGLAYLQSLAPWRGQPGFSLERISRVLAHWGNPQDEIATVHVAGTNGKGSVSTAVAAMLGQSGARVGLNTSPHLSSVNERVIVDGLPVDDELLAHYGCELERACRHVNETLTFHEAITAVAFL